jgi:hypothetical protein
MRRRRRAKVRTLLGGFSSRVGSETLNVRIYRDREAFVCERELVERDGTSFTMVLPFREPEAAREFLEADPYYPRVRSEAARALGALHKALSEEHGDRAG